MSEQLAPNVDNWYQESISYQEIRLAQGHNKRIDNSSFIPSFSLQEAHEIVAGFKYVSGESYYATIMNTYIDVLRQSVADQTQVQIKLAERGVSQQLNTLFYQSWSAEFYKTWSTATFYSI